MSQDTHFETRGAPRKNHRPGPPGWLMAALVICVALVAVYALTHQGEDRSLAAEPTPPETAVSTPEGSPAPTPSPTPEPTPSPTPEPAPAVDYSQPVAEGEPVEMDWFADAVFIGDSRVDGFKLYSGVTGMDYLDYTGLTVYDVVENKKVIRSGNGKISILEALAQKEYGKVYIALGINELGYFNADGFADTFGQLVDAVRECQPGAAIYIQSIIPVNTGKCKANDQPDYVTNEGIAGYNAALAQVAEEKEVFLLGVPGALLDENGEMDREYSADGVHFKKEGYVIWRDYLMCHTGT